MWNLIACGIVTRLEGMRAHNQIPGNQQQKYNFSHVMFLNSFHGNPRFGEKRIFRRNYFDTIAPKKGLLFMIVIYFIKIKNLIKKTYLLNQLEHCSKM